MARNPLLATITGNPRDFKIEAAITERYPPAKNIKSWSFEIHNDHLEKSNGVEGTFLLCSAANSPGFHKTKIAIKYNLPPYSCNWNLILNIFVRL
jgi:hypothetical protein